MKYTLILLISFNALAEIKYTRLDADGNNQGSFIVDTHKQANKRIKKMLKVKNSWMKCLWSQEVHDSNITRVVQTGNIAIADDPETPEIDETVMEEVTLYCTPQGFSITSEDVTQELADKTAAKQVDKDERVAIKAMISDVNASDKPNWEKKLLRKLIKDMRD